MNRPKVLIIDDEKPFLALLTNILGSRFEVLTADHALLGMELAMKEKPDIVLLDVMMPDVDGISACEKLRADPTTKDLPVIMVTCVDTPSERTTAFVAGADDYVVKPFKSSELIARIESKLRRFEELKPRQKSFTCGNLTLDFERLQAVIGDLRVPLSLVEFNLLKLLVEHQNNLVTREQMLRDVWKDSNVTPRSVDTHIANLRKKLVGFDHMFSSVYGAGYILKR